jgi:hypothetical protein
VWPDGGISVADIRNCRVLLLDPATRSIRTQLGKTGTCVHHPPKTFGLPNGDTPLKDGNVLVTEIAGNWVSEMGWDGSLKWTVRAPGIHYASDAQMLADGNILLVDYWRPGQVLIMTPQGKVVWRYALRSGAGLLDHPSLAIQMSNGLIALNDDFRNRVVVIDHGLIVAEDSPEAIRAQVPGKKVTFSWPGVTGEALAGQLRPGNAGSNGRISCVARCLIEPLSRGGEPCAHVFHQGKQGAYRHHREITIRPGLTSRNVEVCCLLRNPAMPAIGKNHPDPANAPTQPARAHFKRLTEQRMCGVDDPEVTR